MSCNRPQGTSPVDSGKSDLLSSCKGTLEFLLNRCRGIGLHLVLRWETGGSSLVVTGISWFLRSINTGFRPRLMLQHGTPLSSRVVKGVSGLLSSSGGELELFLEVQQGSQTSIRVVQANSAIHSSHCRGIRPYFELRV